ncbi:MAG: hypothetical protein SFW67_33575 [Myxococcaceae bacterium]|nr:hypothetical protein [Myxococcaceae bacterium]
MNDSTSFVKWLRERIEPSLERARTTDDPFTAWLVLEDVDDAFEGRAAMLWGAVISSHVPVLRRELGAWIDTERAALAKRCEGRLLELLGLQTSPAPAGGLLASVKRLFSGAPSKPAPELKPDRAAAVAWARRAGTAVLGLLDHPAPAVRQVVVEAQTRETAKSRLVRRLDVETDAAVARALIERLNAYKVILEEPLRAAVARRFPELRPVILLGQVQATEARLRELVESPATRLDAITALASPQATKFAAARNELLLAALDDTSPPVCRAAIAGVRQWNLTAAVPRLQALARAGEPVAFDALVALSVADASPAFELVLDGARRTPPVLTGLDVIARAHRLSPEQLSALEGLLPTLPAGAGRTAIEARLQRHKPGVSAPQERFADLTAAIDANPDDVNAWLVWSDAAQGAGDVRGELVALAHANEPVHEALERALPVLAPTLGEVVEQPASLLDGFTLHMGLPRKAVFRADSPKASQAQVVAAVMGAPLGRFIREVELGLTETAGDDNDWGPAIDVLRRCGANVRSLLLGAFEYPDDSEISWVRWGDVSGVWSLPALEGLHLRGGDGEVGRIESATLRSLTIETGGLSRPVFDAVLSAKLPALRSLTLWTGDPNYGGDSGRAEAEALFDWAPSGLTHLGLENCAYTHELIAPLAKHALTKRLRTLSLANGVLRPNEVDLLLQHRAAFLHLERFDLSANLLDDTAVEMLAREFPNAVFDDQREDYGEDEDRYVAVGE